MSEHRIDEETGIETTGHSWDGIEELNTPLPRWWLWTLYATIVWGIGYVIAYPAFPMISGATAGLLGYSTRAEVAQQIEEHEAKNDGLVTQLVNADLAELGPNSDLHRYAVARAGALGYPNLLDNDWLWGGDLENIALTITHGIRNTTDDEARYSEMPAFGDMLEDSEIDAVVEYVVSLSSADHDASLAAAGVEIFADNCTSCHGDNALGDRDLGAPNLADAIWLYGGDRDALQYTVRNARFGVMPAWGQRLTEADVRAVSVYVHALGGGE